MFFEVMPTESYGQCEKPLTYHSDLPLKIGQIVLIPLGRRSVTGIILRKVTSVNFPTKPIIRPLHPCPLPAHLLVAARWIADYYLMPLSSTLGLLVPAGLTSKTALKTSKFAEKPQNNPSENSKNCNFSDQKIAILPQKPPKNAKNSNFPDEKVAISSAKTITSSLYPPIPLNPYQKTALKKLQKAPGTTSLLRGVTGSGKTNIYLSLAREALLEGKSAVLLVPEIALTSQLVRIFEEIFQKQVVLIHSKQTMTEKRQIWLDLHESTLSPSKSHNSARIVIGPRSALFAPIHNLGLIMIDECHESSYYQESTPRYSALRVASMMANRLKIPCILGSATPSATDYYLAKSKNTLVELTEKAKDSAISPQITVIDLKNHAEFAKNRYYSNTLLQEVKQNLAEHLQTLIFHNRRGSAPLTLCEDCGWQALCPNCYLPMTLHTDSYSLRCHLCGEEMKVPAGCPNCHKPGIIHKGFGTKLLESELARLFPEARICRFDGDNTKEDSLNHLYTEVKTGAIDILIGTQTLARGLDLPHLATVGIVQADAGLALPDFAAEERTFELLTQVIGRVGRGHIERANVVVQTFQPEHYVIKNALSGDFSHFVELLLSERRQAALPPYTWLARLNLTYKTEKTVVSKIQAAYQALSKTPSLTVSPPMPAFHEHTNRGYTWQILLKSQSRSALVAALRPYLGQKNYSVVLDPPSLL